MLFTFKLCFSHFFRILLLLIYPTNKKVTDLFRLHEFKRFASMCFSSRLATYLHIIFKCFLKVFHIFSRSALAMTPKPFFRVGSSFYFSTFIFLMLFYFKVSDDKITRSIFCIKRHPENVNLLNFRLFFYVFDEWWYF